MHGYLYNSSWVDEWVFVILRTSVMIWIAIIWGIMISIYFLSLSFGKFCIDTWSFIAIVILQRYTNLLLLCSVNIYIDVLARNFGILAKLLATIITCNRGFLRSKYYVPCLARSQQIYWKTMGFGTKQCFHLLRIKLYSGSI